ncbi:DUF2147 domain-containing protein [Winogradskyella sp.]|jgi:uncharacterized protein (DUF2147 family)|uniref:DUF2147 domain-containing protein n=1 Tax=Winogradskyella sp. TaxID=1883156 RepID=UPI0025FD79D8|nr:DUF2147 domain-containing protein [Winogradskyella sp.]MCT4629089.1 DUF2147 domain-containing protein [Winogradskyella sp.]
MNRIIIALLFLIGCHFGSAQNILGKWKTIDDETGKEKSIVEIYEDKGKIYGKIVELINPLKENPKCSQCKGERKDQPIKDMVIIEGLEKDDDVYEGGTILNPENGKEYKCRLKIEDDKDTLQVRGYIGFFYKTQYWKRVN